MREFQATHVGDTVKVQFKTLEEGVERTQNFEGTLIRVRGSGPGQTLTVRKISFGVGVERIFPTKSPRLLGIKVVKRGRVRRAKLYYMRKLSGKAHRVAFLKDEAQPSEKPLAQTPPTPPTSSPAVVQ